LRVLGVGGASGLLAAAGLEAIAGEPPHQRLQDRSKQRNRKQRNNKNKNNNDNNGGGGQLGSGQNGQPGIDPVCEAQCQEQFEGCMEPCAGRPSSLEFCETSCDERQDACEARCLPA
jgi:hypothetical protein